jgi:hypothetical protein
LLEAGIETDNPNSVSAAVGMIETLIEKSTRSDDRGPIEAPGTAEAVAGIGFQGSLMPVNPSCSDPI